MHTLFRITTKFYQVAIAFIGIVNLILFLASGHSVNFQDFEQLKLFFSSVVFLTTFFLLFALNGTKNDSERKSLHAASAFGLGASFLGLLYIASELLKVKYGDTRPYFIFAAVFGGLAINVFLLYFFLFRKDVSLQKETEIE
jgi:hypothetical protein